MNRKQLSAYGLKWDPFSADLPMEAIHVTPEVESFMWRVKHLAQQGGFGLVVGESGTGKSITLRLLENRLSAMPDVKVGVLTRPQARLGDFYREMGHLFGVRISPNNRWVGTKMLRERWLAHIQASLFRPVLLVDEAQEMISSVLTELRLMCSTQLDSNQLLSVVLSGDGRLLAKLRTDELIPLGTRIRVRLNLESTTPAELGECLNHILTQAGNPKLMTNALKQTLCEHSAGNYRVLMTMASELLAAAVQRQADHLDEKLFFDVFAKSSYKPARRTASRGQR